MYKSNDNNSCVVGEDYILIENVYLQLWPIMIHLQLQLTLIKCYTYESNNCQDEYWLSTHKKKLVLTEYSKYHYDNKH